MIDNEKNVFQSADNIEYKIFDSTCVVVEIARGCKVPSDAAWLESKKDWSSERGDFITDVFLTNLEDWKDWSWETGC